MMRPEHPLHSCPGGERQQRVTVAMLTWKRLIFFGSTLALGGVACAPEEGSGSEAWKQLAEIDPSSCWQQSTIDSPLSSVTTPAASRRDSFCLTELLRNCAGDASLTVYGSARTGSSGDSSPASDPFLGAVYSDVREMARQWAASTLMTGLLSGGGIGAMDAASRGALQGGTSRTDGRGPQVVGVSADIIGAFESFISDTSRSRFSTIPGTDSPCAYVASSFGLRQTAIATHPPYHFSVTMGGIGTDYEALEVINRLALGELDPSTAHLNFMTPSAAVLAQGDGLGSLTSPLSFWSSLVDELKQYHSADDQRVRWQLEPSSTSADNVQTGLLSVANGGIAGLRVSFAQGAEATAQTLLEAHKPTELLSESIKRVRLDAQLDCSERSKTGATALQRFSTQWSVRRQYGPRGLPNEVERDVRCARQVIGAALGLPEATQHPEPSAADSVTAKWDPRALLVLGSSAPVTPQDKTKLFVEAFVEELLRRLNPAPKDCGTERSKFSGNVVMPLLTPGGGGYLSAAHTGAARAGVSSVGFFLDHGPTKAIELGSAASRAETLSPERLRSYTFTSLGGFEEELIDQARLVVVAPGDLRTAWQLRHLLVKLRQFRSRNSARGSRVPIVLIGSGTILELDPSWQRLDHRLRWLTQIKTASQTLGAMVRYIGLGTVQSKDLRTKASTEAHNLMQAYPDLGMSLAQ